MNFNIINEENKFKLGSIIAVFKLPNNNREIALFSVEDFEGEDMCSLNVAYIDKDASGYDYISEIDDEDVFSKAAYAAQDIINKINKVKNK